MGSFLPIKLRWATKWWRGFRAWDPAAGRSRLRGPLSVEVQTVDRCNAACAMCPYSTVAPRGPARMMDDELYERVLGELRRLGTVETVCLTLQNEPLLDRRLHERVRRARQVLGGDVQLVVVTHGGLLNRVRVSELRDSGLDRISVSIDAVRRFSYERIRPGLDFDAVVANTEALLRDRGCMGVAVKLVKQRDNEGQEREFVRYWTSRGASVSIDRLVNRGGALDAYEQLQTGPSSPVRRAAERILGRLVPCCPLPFASAYILADGRMIACGNDWGPAEIVGDLTRESIADVWNGRRLNHVRDLLGRRRTDESRVCRECSLSRGFWDWVPSDGRCQHRAEAGSSPPA